MRDAVCAEPTVTVKNQDLFAIDTFQDVLLRVRIPSHDASGAAVNNVVFGIQVQKKTTASEKRWENKERGPKGPIKERYTGRLGGLYDDPNDTSAPLTDFDDPAMRAEDDDQE